MQRPPSHWLLGNVLEIGMFKWVEEAKDMMTNDYDILFHILPHHVQDCQAYGGFIVQVSHTSACIQKFELYSAISLL